MPIGWGGSVGSDKPTHFTEKVHFAVCTIKYIHAHMYNLASCGIRGPHFAKENPPFGNQPTGLYNIIHSCLRSGEVRTPTCTYVHLHRSPACVVLGSIWMSSPEALFGGRRRWVGCGKMSSGRNRTGKGEGNCTGVTTAPTPYITAAGSLTTCRT